VDETSSTNLPFVADLAFSLSYLSCQLLSVLYTGPEVSKDEKACQHLFNAKLLQRFKVH